MSTEPQEPWASAMLDVRATDPRTGMPSWNQLAILAGVSTSTLTRAVAGRSTPSVDTIQKVAAALRKDPSVVSEWFPLGRPVQSSVYEVPHEVHLLSRRQQGAVTELIRAMAENRKGAEGDEPRRRDAPSTSPGGVKDPRSRRRMPPTARGLPTTLSARPGEPRLRDSGEDDSGSQDLGGVEPS